MKKHFLQSKKTPARMAVEGDLLVPHEVREKKTPRDGLFGWTVFLLILIGLVFACWMGSFYVFEHPENPRSYSILRKLKKIDPPKRFEPTAAPLGRFYSVEQLLKFYDAKSDAELAQINTELLQSYIGNYSVKEREVPYLMGHFTVLLAQPLKSSDMITSGYVVLARSVADPRLHIEQLYPAEAEYVPDLERMLTPGVEVKLERTYDLSAVLHVERWADGRLQVTIIPLNYDSYGLGDGRAVRLSPPLSLNLTGPLPIFGAKQFDEGGEAVATETPTGNQNTPAVVARSGPTPDQSVIQVARALPVKGAPVPIPKATPGTVPAATPKVLTAIPVAPPKATPAMPVAVAEVSPSPTPKGVVASLAAVPTKPPAQWQTYKPGQMPRGRLVDVPDLNALAKNGGPAGTTYLQGSFVVKAIDGNRAVLRTNSRIASAIGLGNATGQTRVIVEYPSGQSAPPTGTQISRGKSRPFQITSVQRASNGQINVFVREITEP